MAVNTGTTWKKVQKKTSLSQHEIWSVAVQRGTLQRQGKKTRNILPGTHTCICTKLGLPVDGAVSILVQTCKDQQKQEHFAVYALLNIAQA